MLTEEGHSAGVADGRQAPGGVADKIAGHEQAAHEKRNWVRLTYACNNKCVFCLDSDTHDGRMRDREEVKRQILDGRKLGATRLILSGGEPTIHPSYVDFITLGARAGYRKIQTVTNGRLFQYPEFLTRCLDAGLSEITFSLHGPNARIHDALVGVPGAFEQELEGLRAALAERDRRGLPVVNIDIVINRANVKHLDEMLTRFYAMGVREFDLLQVVPFGRAFTDGRDTLFYDLAEARPHLEAALAWAKKPDVHLWLNRFPPQHLEGHEHLIQDPYKLTDEVRGRKEEFARLLDEGVALDCREPERCRYCYLEALCDGLDGVRARVSEARFSVLRVDSEAEARVEPVFGGDPASAKRADGFVHLQLASAPPARRTVEELVRDSGARRLWIRAPDLARARAVLADFPSLDEVELELDSWSGLIATGVALPHGRLVRALCDTPADAEALLATDGNFEVVVSLSKATEAWLLALERTPPRLVVRQPTHERLTESAGADIDLRAFFERFSPSVPVEDVPECLASRPPRARPEVLDASMLEDGRLEIFRYTRRWILDGYRAKPLRCRECRVDAACAGLHINQVRSQGFAQLRPIR